MSAQCESGARGGAQKIVLSLLFLLVLVAVVVAVMEKNSVRYAVRRACEQKHLVWSVVRR